MPRLTGSGTESQLKRSVMKMLALEYPRAVVRKRHGSMYSTAGDPDLEILLAGVHIECELKRPGENPTQLQQRRLAEWAAAGAVTACVHSVGEMREVMHGVVSSITSSKRIYNCQGENQALPAG